MGIVSRRVAGLGVLALVAWFAWAGYARWDRAQEALVLRAEQAGLEGEALAAGRAGARRESDLALARIEIARAILQRELLNQDPTSPESFERLALARELAVEAIHNLPASSEAAMILGATRSLERSRARDTRLFSLAVEWERPLTAAMALAPGSPAPRRLLAAAYLEGWPVLSPTKRALAESLLREAFRDPPTFERLFTAWVAIAGSLERAADLLPDEPRSWQRLSEVAFRDHSWGEFAALTNRYRAALLAELTAGLDGAAKDSARANVAPFAAAILRSPRDLEFAPLVERALASRPPGLASPEEAAAAEAWIEWVEPLCLVRGCPLSENSISRLASLAGERLAPEQAAFAALAAGDSTRAELIERRTESSWSEAWAPFLTLRATRLADDGDLPGAQSALAAAHRAFRRRVAWRRVDERLSGASAGRLRARPIAATTWEASDWWFERGASRLDLVPARAAPALELELATPAPAPHGALFELLWDGERLPLVQMAAGESRAAVPLSVTAGAHLLEARVLAGALRPATRVRLR